MNEIEKARRAYYVDGIRLMSDEEYDQKTANLEKKIGIKRRYKNSVIHEVPMLSMHNTYDILDIPNFFKKKLGNDIYNTRYIISPKIDGVAVSVVYENGILVQASTRGDGHIGKDITEKVKKINSVPQKIDALERLEYRGEAFVSYLNYKLINRYRLLNGDEPYYTPLQAVTSILKKNNSDNLDKLSFCIHSNPLEEMNPWIKASLYGLPINEYMIQDFDDIEDTLRKLTRKYVIFSTIVPMDGIVIAIYNYELCKKLGATKTAPNWCIAYKFKKNFSVEN